MRVLDFIVAEDVRQEIGNKVSVMGIIGDTMTFSFPESANKPSGDAPFPFHLGIFIRLLSEAADEKPDRFTLTISLGGQQIAGAEGTLRPIGLDLPMGGHISLPIIINPLPIIGPGELKIKATVYSGSKALLEESNPFPIFVEFKTAG